MSMQLADVMTNFLSFLVYSKENSFTHKYWFNQSRARALYAVCTTVESLLYKLEALFYKLPVKLP